MSYGEQVRWEPATPRIGLARLIVSWLIGAAAVWVASAVLPGVSLEQTGAAFLVAAVVALMNAVLPPLLAALRLPLMLVTGFVLLLLADAFVLWAAHEILPDDIHVDSFGDAFLAAILMAAVSLVLQVVLGTNDDDRYNLSVTRRIARRQGAAPRTDVPGIVFLEIDGLALPVLRDAMRDGSAPALARWIADDGYRLVEWETDLSSQTGASQAGILLGSNEDIPAFRWVEKAEGRLVACSAPGDCAEIERKRATGAGLLVNGGTSRGNLLSGEADETILTVSRTDAERGANPGYRAFFANGFNVTRTLVLMGWEIGLEVTAATRARRRDIRPRGHRGGIYPLLRAVMCVLVRDLNVYSVLTDMMRGRPAVYATFASYDEVAHHSGLERADTLEALRKLDQQFDRIARARRYAPRPYEIAVLSDHGQTQGATFKTQRLRAKSRPGRTVTVRVRFADLRAVTRSVTLDAPISATATLAEIAEELVRTALADHPTRRPSRSSRSRCRSSSGAGTCSWSCRSGLQTTSAGPAPGEGWRVGRPTARSTGFAIVSAGRRLDTGRWCWDRPGPCPTSFASLPKRTSDCGGLLPTTRLSSRRGALRRALPVGHADVGVLRRRPFALLERDEAAVRRAAAAVEDAPGAAGGGLCGGRGDVDRGEGRERERRQERREQRTEQSHRGSPMPIRRNS